MLDLTRHFSRFRTADPDRINLAAHSHHDWPDVAFEAQDICAADAARYAGGKWDVVFGEVVPAVQRGISRVLGLPDPTTIAFSPNTHDFLLRILSCFPPDRPVRVLTSDAEFHTARRQFARLAEDGLLVQQIVATQPFESFADRFSAAARAGGHDLVFVSQVFFSAGAVAGPLDALVGAVPDPETLVILDGYHGYLAVPTDLSAVAGRAFYTSGGYKYAMAGEGCCFLHCPPGFGARPRATGWFSAFGALSAPPGSEVGYPEDGGRFLGATFDPIGLYRARAVLGWLDREGLTAMDVHAHASALMARFLDGLDGVGPDDLGRATLVTPFPQPNRHGNFLAFRTPRAPALEASLALRGIHTDHRNDILRFGFGIALSASDVDQALERIRATDLG